MSAGVGLEIRPEELSVGPGEVGQVTIVLRNQGEALDQFDLDVRGLDAGWYTLSVRGVALFPGDREEITLAIHPPRAGMGGSYRVEVSAVSRTDPTNQTGAAWTLRVARAEKPPAELVPEKEGPPAVAPPVPPPEPPRKKGGVALELQPPVLQMSAGEEQVIVGRVANTGEVVDQYEITVAGLEPGWYTAEPTSVSLFPGDSGEVKITVRAPTGEGSRAGDFTYTVRAISQADAAVTAQAQGIVRIRPVFGLEVDLRPRKQTGTRGRFELELSNRGNAPLTVVSEGEDQEGQCRFATVPPEPAMGPFQTRKVPLKVGVRRFFLVGQPKSYRFKLALTPREWPQGKKEVEGELVHRPLFRTWKPILYPLGLLLALFVVIKAGPPVAAFGKDRLCGLLPLLPVQFQTAGVRLACEVVKLQPTPTPKATIAAPAEPPTAAPAATAPPATPTEVAFTWPGRLVFVSGGPGGNAEEIELLSAGGAQRRRLTENSFEDALPELGPDGSLIAFHSNRDGNFEIYVMGLDGGQPRNLTHTPDRDERGPAWSPDGQLIVYEVGKAPTERTLWIMRADGSEQRPLLEGGEVRGRGADWSPSEPRLAYSLFDGKVWQIVVVSLRDRTFTQLTNDKKGGRFPEWTPDGKMLVYNSWDPSADGPDILWLHPLGGDARKALTDRQKVGAAGFASLSRDGRWLFFNADEGQSESRLYVMDLQSGEVTAITPRERISAYAANWGP